MHPFLENHSGQIEAYTITSFDSVPHIHSDIELFYLVEGEADVTVQRMTRRLSAGSLAVIFPNQVHCYSNLSPDIKATFLICSLSLTGGFGSALTKASPDAPFLPSETLHPQVHYALEALLEESTGARDRAVCSALLQLILARVLPKLALHEIRNADCEFLTCCIAQYISTHYSEHISLESLAEELEMSKFHLSRLFGEKMGLSFPAYLTHIRLDQAAVLLQNTDHSITEICDEVGFNSLRSFFRVFRERYGMTPKEYRRNRSERSSAVINASG